MAEILTDNLWIRALLLLIIFAACTAAFAKVAQLAAAWWAVRSQLQAIGAKGLAEHGQGPSLENRDESAWAMLATRLEKAGLSLADTKGDRLRERMIAAGYRSPLAPKIFTMIRFALVFLLPAVYLLFFYMGGQEVSFLKLYLYATALAAVGLYLPNLFVQARIDRRREAITNGFPDSLDLMLVCIEAGLGLEAAMNRVGREMMRSHPLIAELLSTATLQMRAGASREDALRAFGAMSGVDDIRSFATLLIQSDKMGTSIGASLRIYAMEMREKRKMRAEEKAHRLPVLISIPLVVFMLPTMISVLMLPGIIRIIEAFG